MPDVRYGKPHGYRVLDLRNNLIRSVNGFNVYRYDRVDLRGNPISSCIDIPLDIVQTDNCGVNTMDDREKTETETGTIEKDTVYDSTDNERMPDIKKVKDIGPNVHGVDQVDNRSGKMVIVVVSASGGGIGVLITIIATTIIHLYKKGVLGTCYSALVGRLKGNRPVCRDIELDDISPLHSFGPPSDWLPMPSTSTAESSQNNANEQTMVKTLVNARYNPEAEKRKVCAIIDSCQPNYQVYGENTTLRTEESMDIDDIDFR